MRKKRTWDELSPEIQELMLFRTRDRFPLMPLSEQLDTLKTSLTGAFGFYNTPEGHDWWTENLLTDQPLPEIKSSIDELLNFLNKIS